MKGTKHILTFSGGKDSLDTLIWAKNTLPFDQWEIVTCDTDWEHGFTYEHIKEVEAKIGKKMIVLKATRFSDKLSQELLDAVVSIFGGRNVFAEMVLWKGRFPSTKARFCTEELKSIPMIDYILSQKEDVVVVQGVRAEESEARRNMKANDEYFKFYFEPYKIDKKGRPKFHTYRKDDVIAHCDNYSVDVVRPILTKTAAQVFGSIYDNGFEPNKLYKKGSSRVGCFPCVMCRKDQIRIVAEVAPERIDQIGALEALSNSTFFPPGYIPKKYCSKTALVHLYLEDLLDATNKNLYNPALFNALNESPLVEKHLDEDGDIYVIKRMKVPTIRDVVRYVMGNPDQTSLYDTPTKGCVSVYNICERA